MEQDGFIVENFAELERAFKINGEMMSAACASALARGAAGIVAEAQRNLRTNRSNTTGLLSNSGRAEKLADGEYQAGFFAKAGQGYAEYVENGRRGGRMPPPKIIEAWVRKKLRIKDRRKAASAAFALALHIARHGTKAHPFFGPAVRSQQKAIMDEITKAARRIIDKP